MRPQATSLYESDVPQAAFACELTQIRFTDIGPSLKPLIICVLSADHLKASMIITQTQESSRYHLEGKWKVAT
jgi:hypothetical protein